MRTTLRCGRIIDGTGADPLESALIHVEDGMIREIGTARGDAGGGSARVFDLRAYTVLPGLIDAHDHLCFDWSDPKEMLAREPDAWSVLRGAANARTILRAGITTLRVMGEKNHLDLLLKRAIGAAGKAMPSWMKLTPFDRAKVFAGACSRSGVYFAPRHNWFISAAHTDRDLEQTLNVTEQAFAAVRKQFGA